MGEGDLFPQLCQAVSSNGLFIIHPDIAFCDVLSIIKYRPPCVQSHNMYGMGGQPFV